MKLFWGSNSKKWTLNTRNECVVNKRRNNSAIKTRRGVVIWSKCGFNYQKPIWRWGQSGRQNIMYQNVMKRALLDWLLYRRKTLHFFLVDNNVSLCIFRHKECQKCRIWSISKNPLSTRDTVVKMLEYNTWHSLKKRAMLLENILAPWPAVLSPLQ